MVFPLQEVDGNYTKTPSIHLSHGRECEGQLSLLIGSNTAKMWPGVTAFVDDCIVASSP